MGVIMLWGIIFVCVVAFVVFLHRRAFNALWDSNQVLAKHLCDLVAYYLFGTVPLAIFYFLSDDHIAFLLWSLYFIARLRQELKKNGP